MRRLRIGLGIAGLLAAPTLAQQAEPAPQPGAPMRGPTTRTDALAAVRAQFARMDANGDGVIGRDEFDAARAAMRAGRGAPPAGDGAASQHPPRGGMGGMGGHWFERVDANGDGRVTPAEAEKAAMTMFDMVDADHDGTISPDERRAAMAMMRAMRPERGE